MKITCLLISTDNIIIEGLPAGHLSGPAKSELGGKLLESWCKKNCNGGYVVESGGWDIKIYFEDMADATAFKLRWM